MKVTFFSILLSTTLLFTIQASHAETFRWVDESGKIRIGIKPPAKPATVEKDADSNTKTNKTLPVIAEPVTPKVVEKQAAPVTKTVETPKTAAPVVKPAPAPIVVTPEVAVPAKSPALIQPPKPVQKTSVKKPEPVKKKASVKKPVAKKAVSRKKPEKAAPVKKKTTTTKSSSQRNEEMCGVFTGYVNDYEEKVRECSPNLCDIYKRSLARYKKKQRSYCK
ncbi:MAG: hypothetical protein GXP18_09705 [Gammaproteobacteria bacterium]|nr:hypothetical protein [Gammaproteobacteria bacterium]